MIKNITVLTLFVSAFYFAWLSQQSEAGANLKLMATTAGKPLKKWQKHCFYSVTEQFRSADKDIKSEILMTLISDEQEVLLKEVPLSLNIKPNTKNNCKFRAEIDVLFEPVSRLVTIQWNIFEKSGNKRDEFAIEIPNR